MQLTNNLFFGRLATSAMINMAGEEGFEPSHAGIKIQCLNQLGDSPADLLQVRFARMSCQSFSA